MRSEQQDRLRRWARRVEDRLSRLEREPDGEAIARAVYRANRKLDDTKREAGLKLALLDKQPEDFSRSKRICDCGRLQAHHQVRIEHEGKTYGICPYLLTIRLQRLKLHGHEPTIDYEFLREL